MADAGVVWLANPRGFCAGVERAIEIVERLLERHGPPIYVKHEVVHNTFVIRDLEEKGAIFTEDLGTVPAGSLLVFSAHGVSQAVRKEAASRGLNVYDATCPLVTKVHAEVARHHRLGREVLMVGHEGHPEVEGTMGQVPDGIVLVEDERAAREVGVRDPSRLAYVTQTTLSVDETRDIIAVIRERFPEVVGPAKEDICYATQNRQDAVKAMAGDCDLVLVVGSATSSNSNRLREVAEKCGARAKLVDGPEALDASWLEGCARVGVTAGASAPEGVVQRVVKAVLGLRHGLEVRELDGVTEDVSFAVPRSLDRPATVTSQGGSGT